MRDTEFLISQPQKQPVQSGLNGRLPGADEQSRLSTKAAIPRVFRQLIPGALEEKISLFGSDSGLGRQYMASDVESDVDLQRGGLIDPIGDQAKNVEGTSIIHRYESRVLFLATKVCPVACRFCFRRNELSAPTSMFDAPLGVLGPYLREHPHVEEVIFSGGDPLMIPSSKLAKHLDEIASVGTVKWVRFHTRVPVTLPTRVDQGLLATIGRASQQFSRVHIAIHVNHLSEIGSAEIGAIKALQRGGAQLLSQSVLLRGVNDSPDAIVELLEKLIELDIRPYYLHHADPVYGAMHFRVPLKEARVILREVRRRVPGWAMPQYVVDHPSARGKRVLGLDDLGQPQSE